MSDSVLRIGCWLLPLALLGVGCTRSDAGPATLQISTPGDVYEDYVIRPSEDFSTLHGGYAQIGDWTVVSSGETVQIAMSTEQPDNLTGLTVSAVHPEFRYAWTAGSPPRRGGPFRLPLMTPERWSTYLAEHELVDYTTVIDHLSRVLDVWVPTIGAESTREIDRYLPILRQLIESAAWTTKDESFFANEVEARTEMLSRFEAIRRLAE